MLRLALTPRWLGFLALVLVLVTAFVGLSAWQLNRAQHKNDVAASQGIDTARPLVDTLDAQEPMAQRLVDQRVSATGRFLPDAQVLIVDRVHDGETGVWVVTMFAPDGARVSPDAEVPAGEERTVAVPVVRGWAPTAEAGAASRAPSGEVELTARLEPVEGPEPAFRLPDGQFTTLSTSQLVNRFDMWTYSGALFPETMAVAGADAPTGESESGEALAPVVIEKQVDGGFDWQSGVYAVEWLIFAVFAVYIWFTLLRDAHAAQRRAAGDSADESAHELVVVKAAGERRLRTAAEISAADRAAAGERAGEPASAADDPARRAHPHDTARTDTAHPDEGGPHP